jgi:hypothetical protein
MPLDYLRNKTDRTMRSGSNARHSTWAWRVYRRRLRPRAFCWPRVPRLVHAPFRPDHTSPATCRTPLAVSNSRAMEERLKNSHQNISYGYKTNIFSLDSSLWMPLNGCNQLENTSDYSKESWASSICAMPSSDRTKDCCLSFCCSLCAFSEDFVSVNHVTRDQKRGKATPSDADLPEVCAKYWDCCSCCIYVCFVSLVPIPCCLFCMLRHKYRDSFNIKGGCFEDFMATMTHTLRMQIWPFLVKYIFH